MDWKSSLMGLVGTGQWKKQDGGRSNDGSPCYLKLTSFAEIVQVADCQKVPDLPRKNETKTWKCVV